MNHPAAPHFNPTWRDDVFDVQAIDIPLALPGITPRNNNVWIDAREVLHEIIFGHKHLYESYRRVISVLKPSDMAQYYKIEAQDGSVIAADDPAIAVLFPAKAWMSDSGEERCMMFAAAKRAKGHVLIGGLGLCIYPQFVFALQRPVVSVTIVERDPKVIELMKNGWFQKYPDHAKQVTIVEDTIEAYLIKTEKTFDTIYLDTLDDADPRFIAHVNYLLALASCRCADEGIISCWGYAMMIEMFTKNIETFTQKAFPLQDYHLDPALQAYVDWRKMQNDVISKAAMTQAANRCALMTKQPIETYDRHRCFTAFGTSMADAHRNMALSQKNRVL